MNEEDRKMLVEASNTLYYLKQDMERMLKKTKDTKMMDDILVAIIKATYAHKCIMKLLTNK